MNGPDRRAGVTTGRFRQSKLGFRSKTGMGRRVNPYATGESDRKGATKERQPCDDVAKAGEDAGWEKEREMKDQWGRISEHFIYSATGQEQADDAIMKDDDVEDDIVTGFGDQVPEGENANVFRLYFQNICGLKLQKSTNTLVETVGFLKQFDVSLVGLAETNINWRQSDTKTLVDSHLRLGFGHSRMSTNSSGLPSKNLYQAGGTLTAALGKWSGRKMDIGGDPEGGFSWIRLRGRKGRKITFITCYRVPQSSGAGLGDTTAFIQQQTLLRLRGVAADPREHALIALTSLVMERCQGGEEIVLMMDANERLLSEKGRLHKFMTETGLVDAIGYRHHNPPRTSLRGRYRIDYILVSPALVHSIVRAGHLGIHEAIMSDHSGIWVDFDSRKLFRGTTDSLGSTLADPFTAREIKKMDRYNEAVNSHLTATNVEHRLGRLNSTLSDHDFIELYERISNDVDDAMRAGINKVRRRNVGYARSPELTKAASFVRFWRTQLRAVRNRIALSKAARKFASTHGLPPTVQPQQIVFRRLHEAWAALRTIQRAAAELRSEWLNDLVESAAAEKNVSREAALKQIVEENRLRKLYRRLKPLGKGLNSGSIARILIPRYNWFYHSPSDSLYHYSKGSFYAHARLSGVDRDLMPFTKMRTRRPLPTGGVRVAEVSVTEEHILLESTREEDGLWEEITESERIEELLLERNAEHLRQSTVDETPFAVPPLNGLFGLYGTNEKADALLRGQMDTRNLPLSEEAKLWLQSLQYDNGMPEEVDVEISPETFRTITRKCNPRTAASPSGFGYAVWRANGRSDIGCRVHSRLMSIPFERGFAPQRWKKCLEIMLEKEAGSPMIHRLRIIVLLEADFNLALRTIWMHRLFKKAEEAKFVDEQWGNRKRKNALDCLSMKLLTCESCRIMRSNAALMAMDAAACYDRILTYLSNISERKYGLPKSACVTKSSAVFEMERRVRTAFGVSAAHYTSTVTDLMHGECQGKTSSPPSWAILTISLLKTLQRINPGITITNVQGNTPVSRVADMFVDDCDLWTSLPRHESESKLVEAFAAAAQGWERILFASGGLLALHKCYWWLIAWDWQKGLPECRDITSDQHRVALSNGIDSGAVPIKRLTMDEANVGLGFRMAPSGSQAQEISHRQRLSDQMAAKMNGATLTPVEAWVFYDAIYRPKVFYPAKLTAFTREEWDNVTRKFTHAIIRQMGFNGHTARRIVYGPRRLGGIGIIPGWVQQGTEGVLHFLSHVRGDTNVGRVMINTLSQLQLLSGQRRCLLENPEPLPRHRQRRGQNLYRWYHLGQGWLLSLRHYLYVIKGRIILDDAWTPELVRENDETIMDAFLGRCDSTEYELALANSVRLYLRVLTLSDITSMNGQCIESWARNGHSPRKSSLNWPVQPRPTLEAVRVWRRFLTTAFGTTVRTPKASPLQLRHPLGAWIRQPHVLYPFYVDETHLYSRHQDGVIEVHKPYRISKRIYPHAAVAGSLPNEAVPVKAITRRLGITVPGGKRRITKTLATNSAPRAPGTTDAEQERRILCSLPPAEDNAWALKNLQRGKLIAATDGSLDPHAKRAAGSWVLSDRKGKKQISGVCPVDGDGETLDSYRAELEAIRALVYYIRYLRRKVGDVAKEIELILWVDNEQALRQGTSVQSDQRLPDNLGNENDIVGDIRRVCTAWRIRLVGKHVKSHQEGKAADKPVEVRLNDRCDTLAKQQVSTMKRVETTTRPATRPPGDVATLILKDKMVTNWYRRRLRLAGMSTDMIAYLCSRNEWTWETVEKIDWEHFEIAIDAVLKQSKTRFSRLIKFQHEIQNTGRQRKLFSTAGPGPVVSDRCPCCMIAEETTMHLHQCLAPEMRAVLTEGLHNLEDKLRLRQMPSEMWTALRQGIWSFCGCNSATEESNDEAIRAATRTQQEIGWDNFMKGRVAKEWGDMMGTIYEKNAAYRRTESRRRFLKTLIFGVWELYDDLWKKRCEKLHDMTDIHSISVMELDKRIKFNFENKRILFDSGDYDRFHLGLQNTLALSVSQKRAWIQTLTFRQIATERARRRLVNKIRPITAYFDQVDTDKETRIT